MHRKFKCKSECHPSLPLKQGKSVGTTQQYSLYGSQSKEKGVCCLGQRAYVPAVLIYKTALRNDIPHFLENNQELIPTLQCAHLSSKKTSEINSRCGPGGAGGWPPSAWSVASSKHRC